MRLPRLSIVVLLLLALPALNALAQGMGDELVLSRLGDPVEVEIDVRDWQQLDLARVQVVNATPQQYAAFGLTYQPLLDTLSFNLVGPNLAGEVKILVSSRDPVAEPFLELLLTLRWPEGSALREYVLLFDPPLPEPTMSEVAPIPAEPLPTEPVELPIAEATAVPAAAELAVEPPQELPMQPSSQSPEEPPAREAAGRREYRVQDGDTLQGIAGRFMAGAVADNVYQLLLSLYQLNPDAFIDGNITLLRSDALLQIPSTRDMAMINPLSAQQIFDQRWLEGVQRLQEPPPPSPVVEPELPPGTELASEAPAAAAVLPASTVAALVETPVEPAVLDAVVTAPTVPPSPPIEVAAQETALIAVEPAPSPAVAAEPVADGTNEALQQITSQAESIRNLLLVRQQRLAAVEQQILALRSQLQQAGSQAGELARAVKQDTDVVREAVLLGLVAALLLIALAFTVVTALRWAHELSGYRR